MKHLLLILFLLQGQISFTQYIYLKLDIEKGKKELYDPEDNFYIAGLTDVRYFKTDDLGIVKKRALALENIRARFENDNVEQHLDNFLTNVFPQEKGKIPLYAELKFINISEIHEYSTNFIGSATLEIDFYEKTEKGEKILAGQYHSSIEKTQPYGVQVIKENIIYEILGEALATIGTLKEDDLSPNLLQCMSTSYIPKKGFYNSFLDYIYNTPVQSNVKHKVKYDNNNKIIIKKDNNDPEKNYFGYSDGQHFYIFTNLDQFNYVFKRSFTAGRYLFIEKSFVYQESSFRFYKNTDIPKLRSLRINSKGAVIDLLSRAFISVQSKDFVDLLEQSPTILSELEQNNQDKEAIINAINQINANYQTHLDY
jgi:hypothetical protein